MNFVKFHVTGVNARGKRFKRMTFSSFHAASMINLWDGSVGGVTNCGKRKLLKRVYN